MKAFVNKPGGLGIFITSNYKTLNNLIKYGVKPYIRDKVEVEVFYDWDNRYGTADKTLTVSPNSCTISN